MSLANYAGLKASIASWATRSDLTVQIPDFVTWAQQEIGRRLRCSILLRRATATIATETLAVPTDFAAIRAFYLETSPRRTLTVNSPEGIIDFSAAYANAPYPTDVAVEGEVFRFGPTFTGSATGLMVYYAIPAAMVADTDVNAVLTKYPMLYLFGALEALFRYLEDDDNAQVYGGQFGALIESINQTSAADAMSGPLQLRPYPGGIV